MPTSFSWLASPLNESERMSLHKRVNWVMRNFLSGEHYVFDGVEFGIGAGFGLIGLIWHGRFLHCLDQKFSIVFCYR